MIALLTRLTVAALILVAMFPLVTLIAMTCTAGMLSLSARKRSRAA